MLLQRLGSKVGKSPFPLHATLLFGLMRGSPQAEDIVSPNPHLLKAPTTTIPPMKTLKAMLTSLASSQLRFVLKEQEDKQTPVQLHKSCLFHLFHPAPFSSPQISPPISLEVSCPTGPNFFTVQLSGHVEEE